MYFQTVRCIELDSKPQKSQHCSGQVKILVDGLGVGDVGNIVLRDRKHLSQDGLIIVVVTISHDSKEIVSKPDVISRGFVYVREANRLSKALNTLPAKAFRIVLANVIWIGQL